MSSSDLPTQFLQSQTSALGAGIVGLFIQGIEAGLVFAQFSQWFYGSDRSEGSLSSAVIVFVTVVGLVQSGLSFASAWSQYVQNSGVLLFPKWPDYLQSIPTLVISVPIQALMIRRCYYLVSKNMFIVTPLVLLLVASTIFSLWSTISIIRFVISIDVKDPGPLLEKMNTSWLYLISILLPSGNARHHSYWHLYVARASGDIVSVCLSSNSPSQVLRYLTQTMKRVYATRIRKRISRLTNIVWQTALPPTLCTTFLCVIYVRFSTAHQEFTGVTDADYQLLVIR
ncbi:hypothetical protein H4582DRAFT_2079345 [Lactarius indigo]|nr:hypothetical protein H4582DRAFT_2079345 [Lactarius indigo]